MKGKKIIYSRMIKMVLLLLPVVLLVLLFPVNDFDDAPRLRNFYLEERNTLDVVLIGSSENYAGYSPVLAYEEYGFTSYPYTLSANAFSLFRGQLEEVLRVQSPKVIVVDIAEAAYPKSDDDTVFRQFMAGIPLSPHKIAMIQEHTGGKAVLSYYFPFFVNHGKPAAQTVLNYIKTNLAVQKRGYSLLKGTLTFTGSGENWDGPYVTPVNTSGDHSTVELEPAIIEECKRVLSACKEHPEVTFVFINSPHRITTSEKYTDYQKINAIGKLIQSSGYDFINLESMSDEIGLVPETDFYNNHHMNLYGQYKTTRFLCSILSENYGIGRTELSPENQEKWETCVEYQHLYRQLFDELYQSRDPDEFGLWLQEDSWLLQILEQMRESHLCQERNVCNERTKKQ